MIDKVSGALPPRPHWSYARLTKIAKAQGIGFRGFTAPASLERVRDWRAGMVPTRGFRGFTAPASLERRRQRKPERVARGFRGFTAPASLELGQQPSRRRTEQWFPGLYRPGLIGARPS